MQVRMETAAESSPRTQVKIKLTTRHSDLSLPENSPPILVDTSKVVSKLDSCPPTDRRRTDLRRYALSTLVNTLLQSPKPIPLEFLINGAFLRTSIDDYLTSNGVSAETTLTLEYVRAVIPPLYLSSFEHDDWVSAVDVFSSTSAAGRWAGNGGAPASGHERILSASYDGLLRVWNMSSQVLATSSPTANDGPASSIKTAKFISPSLIASAGLERTVRLWKYSEDAEGLSASLTPKLELYGHKSSINLISVHHPSSKILSASSDHSVGLWSTKKSDSPPAPSSLLPTSIPRKANKRRKVTPESNPPPQRGPLALLKAHSAPVSDTIFAPNDPTVAYSTSWDHTLRTWDLPTTTHVDLRSTSHALLSLTCLPALNLLAAGTSARHITLIDPRTSATSVTAMTLRGHTNAVVTLAQNPGSAYGLVSGSHDGTCRVWDVRASKSEKGGRVGGSVFVIDRESNKNNPSTGSIGKDKGKTKVFGVEWDNSVGILGAGEDCRVQINRGVDSGSGNRTGNGSGKE